MTPRPTRLLTPKFKLLLLGMSGALLALVLFVWVADQWFRWQTREHVFTQKEDLTPTQFGLLLGTAKYHASGTLNPFYQARVRAAAQLYHDGYLQIILASGDHSTPYYNEPGMMRDDLLDLGVPDESILLDGGGTRTLASVRRLKSEFDQDRVIIISQQFHIERALYQAHAAGIMAQGFVADDAPRNWHVRVRVREVFARLNALYEIHIQRAHLNL
ncbi:vancomycin high temperature exclusion protein [Salinispirillum marinum]|uniref:Vancomycin high temperature exclusion protein n=2 Tax=Saccharospirillaceae TaxID=255527 RepID=A0ABV8BAI7_9GAMM